MSANAPVSYDKHNYFFRWTHPNSLFPRLHEYAPVLQWASCCHQTMSRNCQNKECIQLRQRILYQRDCAKLRTEEVPTDVLDN